MKPDNATASAVESGKQNPNSIFGKDISVTAFNKALVFLCLLGLIVRIGFFVEHAGNPSFGVPTLDQKYYDMVARMLLTGGDLHELHGFRPLLYPMFLAVFYKLGGAAGVDVALFVQHLLGVATGLIVALLGARLFRHRLSGIAAGILYLLAPVPLYFEGELLIESSYVFLICFALWFHFAAAETRGWKSSLLWLLAGGLVALAAQARANILIFLAVYPLFAAWRWWCSRELAALLPLVGLVGAFGMMIPWAFVNMKQTDHFHLIPNGGAVNLYLGNKRGADGMLVGEDVIEALSKSSMSNAPISNRRINAGGRYQDLVEVWAGEEYEAAMRAQGRAPDADPMSISRYWSQRTKDEIKADPAAWLHLLVKKCWLMCWNVEVPNNKSFAFLQGEFYWLRILPVRWVVLFVLSPLGFWAAAKHGNRNGFVILSAYVVLYSAGNIAFFICDRYRYPVWPAMAVIGGGGFVFLIAAIRQQKVRTVLFGIVSIGLMALLSLHNWFGARLPSFAQDFHFRSVAWYEKGHYQKALEDIDRSLALNPLDAGALHDRGNALFALNRLAEAKEAYESTLKLLPGDSGVWNNLGVTLESLDDKAGALQAFRRATECKFPSYNAFLGMAFLQIRLGQLDDAAATLDQFGQLQKSPDAAVLGLRSVVERRRGNLQSADALLQQAQSLDRDLATWAIERAKK